jgi:hypothetical protein
MLACFLNHEQCIWRQICSGTPLYCSLFTYFLCLQKLWLKKEFLGNKVSRRTMENRAALAFIPKQNLIEEFSFIQEEAPQILDDM